jgi:membrane protein implicated in regulation of membrane protease activity
MIKKVFKEIAAYLADWRNWVAHSIIGIAIVCLMVFLPVAPWIRFCLFIAIVTFNVFRMRRSRKKKSGQSPYDG